MNKKTTQLISYVLIFVFIFTMGLWIVDINMGLANIKALGIDLKYSTFIFDNLDPRVSYHSGIILSIIGMFGINASYLWYMRDKK